MEKTRNVDARNKYIKYKNVFSKLSKKAEQNYYKMKFNEISTNAKKIWSEINQICSFKKKSSHTSITKLQIDGNEVIEQKDIVNELNKYFSNVGVNLANKLQKSANDYQHYMHAPLNNSFYCTHIEEHEICTEILNIARKKKANLESYNHDIISKTSSLI